MNLISGVLKEDYSDYVLYFVESLSDELKQEIRSRLSAVCHGVDQAQSAAKIYSYKETAKEFVKRYKSDKNASEKRKKGMIGELLVHIILEIEGRFTTASPFFNMEERSFKKGYDVALFEEKTNELWIAEVKSGEIQKNQKDASAAATGLINTAKNDLKVRLNDYNTSLWLNALNAAKVTMSDSNKGLYPVSKFIERHYIDDDQRNFFTEWNDAFTEQYISGDICRSEQQDALIKFFEKKYNNTISISAPTSYGKSELILSTIKEYKGRKICVLTSTKALLTQTKKRIQQISKGIFPKVVVHPEMYNSKDVSCLAVLTQERLLRVLKKDPALAFDCIIVDEAHEILENNARSRILADVIIVAQKRNPDVAFKFLTPFLADSKNLKIRYTTYDIEGFKVSEYIKTEKYYLYDLKNHTGLKFYDQFLNKFLPISGDENLGFEENVVKKYSAEKNIIYLNKPLDIEKFALDLAAVLPEVKSEIIQRACDNIAEYLQPQYNLITCLRKGIIYHHGSVPDAIRIYIEDLYKENEAIKYVITSSTLLSGVNLPAERMFILDNRRGRSNLSHDSFKNLVGRVCRFNEIFNNDSGTLQRLEPQIYLVFGRYFARNANCENFLCNVAKAEKKYQDEVENVLLSQTKITEVNKEELRHASEFIENYENGAVENYKERYIDTTFGKACIMNGANEIDVFKYENEIQQQVSKYQHENLKINDSTKLLEIINELFIKYLPENGTDSLRRLSNKEARKFYAMMFEWRVENKSYSEMISLFFGYWHQLYRKNRNVMVYVGKWGDVKQEGSNVARYTKFIGKNRTQVVNLAIVRIKEEQDFMDNMLIKYVEVLHDLDLIENRFYSRIKYGTDDESAICLIKNGLSLSSATLLIKKYSDYLQINLLESTVTYDENIILKMNEREENEIQIYEVQNCM